MALQTMMTSICTLHTDIISLCCRYNTVLNMFTITYSYEFHSVLLTVAQMGGDILPIKDKDMPLFCAITLFHIHEQRVDL